MDFREKMHCSGLGFRDYVEALEVERQKIQVFQRELPLCLELVTQTIERCKQQVLSGAAATTEYLHGHQSECTSEHVTSSAEEHVFEEFMPLKRTTCSAGSDDHNIDDDEEQESPADNPTDKTDNKTKSDWLRSVQLWSDPTPDPPQKEESAKKVSVTEVKRNGGAFQPFQRENKSSGKSNNATSPVTAAAPVSSPAPATSSSGGGGGKKEEEKEGQRKQRRNWSPELHKRFLNALQQLGGSHVATPKQIRELMKVDGLTNDEVKSHLQKYRLHTRRPTLAIPANGTPQTPQVVFVGGIWMQPSEYAAAVATAGDPTSAAANRVYAPVAGPPPGMQRSSVTGAERPGAQNKKADRGSHSEERASRVSDGRGVQHSNSPATSSSTHTTTTSPSF